MDRIIPNIESKVVCNKYITLFLLYFIHIKFFVQIILDFNIFLFDAIFYATLLLGLDYKRLRYHFLLVIPIAIISIVNPAAKNLLAILISTYIISQLPLKTILYHNLSAQAIIFILSSFCLFIGITDSVMFEQTDFDMRVRYDYGMGNPNTFALFVYSFLINLYLYKGINKKMFFLIFVPVTCFVSSYTGSRTFLMSMFVLFLMVLMNKFWRRHLRFVKSIMLIFPIFLIIAIVCFSWKYANYPEINELFSGRLMLYHLLFFSLSLNDLLLGTNLINELTIDNSFLHLIFEGGIFLFLCFVYLYYSFVKKISNKNVTIIFPLFISVFVFALTESILTFLLIYGNMIVWILIYKLNFGIKK